MQYKYKLYNFKKWRPRPPRDKQLICFFSTTVVTTGAPGEGEEAFKRSGSGCHQAAAASQIQPGAADQRERDYENTAGRPAREGEMALPNFKGFFMI